MDEHDRRRLNEKRTALQSRISRDAQAQRIAHLLRPLGEAGVPCEVVHDVDAVFDWLATAFPAGRPAVDWQRVPGVLRPGEEGETSWLERVAGPDPGDVTVFWDGGDPAIRLSFDDFVRELRIVRHRPEFWVLPGSKDWLLEWSAYGGWTFAPVPPRAQGAAEPQG